METPIASLWADLEDTWAGLDSLWARGTRVELGVFNGFQLSDPVFGLLDEGVLDGGIDFTEVTDEVFSVSTGRGRNRDLDRTNAGVVSVSFRNETRKLDPRSDSVFASLIVPRRPVRVTADGFPVFTGLVDDWNFNYSLGGQSVASLEGSDAFSLFAREVNAGGSAVEELSGARVEAVLDQLSIPWPQLERDIEDGNATFAAGLLEDNALTYLQQVEESEAGLIFMTKGGRFAFRERLFQPQTDAVEFSDEGGIPYENIQITYGAELLTNEAIVTNATGTATASDATSQVVYGVTSRSVDSLLTDGGLQALADYIVSRYSQPEYRIENVTVNLRALSSTQRAQVLGLELGDQADTVFTPNKIGEAIAIRNRVIGISHDVGVDTHTVSFSFEALPFDFFILNDAVFGKLDNTDGVLGF
jgi:hypothetical protein